MLAVLLGRVTLEFKVALGSVPLDLQFPGVWAKPAESLGHLLRVIR